MTTKKPTTPTPQAIQRLAKKIARDVFKSGDRGLCKCNRIAFKSGEWRQGEREIGEMIEAGLAYVIERSLSEHLAKVKWN